MQVVEPKKAIVDEDVRKAEESAAAANAIKTECEDALAEAIPILVRMQGLRALGLCTCTVVLRAG